MKGIEQRREKLMSLIYIWTVVAEFNLLSNGIFANLRPARFVRNIGIIERRTLVAVIVFLLINRLRVVIFDIIWNRIDSFYRSIYTGTKRLDRCCSRHLWLLLLLLFI